MIRSTLLLMVPALMATHLAACSAQADKSEVARTAANAERWSVIDRRDEVTDARTVTLQTTSTEGDSKLLVNCSSGALAVVVANDNLTPGSEIPFLVNYRFDADTGRTAQPWRGYEGFAEATPAHEFLAELLKRRSLVLNVRSPAMSTVTAHFEVAGLIELMPKIKAVCPTQSIG
ncbi:hypothetical protein [Lysobacter sp. CA199]|uniref:hypothetical protein n=1 Tax=Lysobacter sp. CA199 TaxID=3455608 RepID=UPI003F8CF347